MSGIAYIFSLFFCISFKATKWFLLDWISNLLCFFFCCLDFKFSELICYKSNSFSIDTSYFGTIAINFPCYKTLNFANNNNMNELFFCCTDFNDRFYVLLHFMFFYFNFIMLLHNNKNLLWLFLTSFNSI